MDKQDINYFKEFHTIASTDTITIDGFNVDSPTGTINFYTEAIQKDKISTFLDNITSFLLKNNMKLGEIKNDNSKMYNSPVIRIPILKNPKGETKKDYPPEINMANNNAFFIFNTILKYNKDLWQDPTFNPQELLQRINYYEGETKLEEGPWNKQQPNLSLNELLTKDMLSGHQALSNYDEPKIRSVLSKIKELCVWAINHGHKELYVA